MPEVKIQPNVSCPNFNCWPDYLTSKMEYSSKWCC